jgi:ADP-ribose pyrophosphatase
MRELTEHQRKAIERYFEFMGAHPECFQSREYRKIVTNRSVLEKFSRKNGVVLGLSAVTPYVYFVVDLVEGPGLNNRNITYPYLRVIYRKQLEGAVNIVVLGTIENEKLGTFGSIVFVQQERHATGDLHLELPRGFGEKGLNGKEIAIQELLEETGFVGQKANMLGTTHTDTGLTDAKVSFYHVPVIGKTTQKPEEREAIHAVKLLNEDDVIRNMRNGVITDGFTVQALMLYDMADK